MKQALAAAALAGLVSWAAPAQMANAAANNPLITWQGSVTITSLTAACSTTGFAKGDLLRSIYRPNLDAAEPKTAISFGSTRAAGIIFQSTGNKFMAAGTGNYSGNYIGGRATLSSTPVTGVWTLTIVPATFTAATTSAITIVGTISNFFKVTGCTMGFKGAYQRRP